MNLENYVASIPDFPKEGIIFRDVTPMLQDGEAFREVTKRFADFAKEVEADVVVGPEARGFIFGCPVATELGLGFVPVRKPGKLPRETESVKYDLEYGSNEIQIHKDAIKPGQRVVIVDDLLATGGTVEAAVELIEKLGGVVAGLAFVIDLVDLGATKRLEEKGYKVCSLLKY